MPGPAPDPNALRRDRPSDVAGWTTLPSAPSSTVAPVWPLPSALDREAVLWADLWAKPQATLWLTNGQEHEVALYVRRLVEAEEPESAVALTALVQRLADALLLTIPSMLRARVKIATDEVASQRSRPVAAPKLSARDRLRALNSGA